MKIKTKKQFTLPQLIEWAWENPDLSHGMTFISNGCERVQINFKYTPRGVLNLDILNGINISNNIQFTLEIEEELTEEITFDHIVEINTHGEHLILSNSKIANVIDYESEEFHAYIDGEFKLIWRDGKLVK